MNAKSTERFHLVLIKPSHYDDDGYVIQWLRSAIPSNTLACLNGLALECNQRRVLGDNVDIVVSAYDEMNTRVRVKRVIRQLRGKRALVGLVGVQSNQFPRAMDIARPFRQAGIPVCIGGFHVSGCLAMLPEITPELKEAMDIGISLFAGEAEGRLDELLSDAWQGKLKPLYNYMSELPALEGTPIPLLPAARIRRTGGSMTSFDAGRGCPFQCSFCTIINVQGRKSRHRSADDVERIVRSNLEQGINRFFITDDNFARNREWERIFDRLIAMREGEHLNIKFVIQVDTMCHRLPRFIEKARRAGVARVFIGLETIRTDSLVGARKKQNKIGEYRRMLQEWKRAGVTVFAGYIVGFGNDTRESVLRDIEIIQRELPIDLLEPHCLTPLPGSEDHLKLYKAGAPLDPDLNKYDIEHVTTEHPLMSTARVGAALQGLLGVLLFARAYENRAAPRGRDSRNERRQHAVSLAMVLRLHHSRKSRPVARRLLPAKIPAGPASHSAPGKSVDLLPTLRRRGNRQASSPGRDDLGAVPPAPRAQARSRCAQLHRRGAHAGFGD